MRLTKFIYGSLFALTVTAQANAQATSGVRIPRQKESAPAPVAQAPAPRVDTQVVVRTIKTTDTVYQAAVAAPAPVVEVPAGKGWFGLSGDVVFPVQDMKTNYNTGYGATLPIGYKFASSPFGVRADLGYHRFEGKGAVSDAQVFSGTANLTMDLPFSVLPASTSLYLIGGVGAYDLRHYTQVAVNGTNQYKGDDSYEWGLNGGAGLNIGLTDRTAMYVESQFVTVRTDRATNYVPVKLGLRLF